MKKLPMRKLVEMALDYSALAYEDANGAIGIENRYFSAAAFCWHLDVLDVIAFRGSQDVRDWTLNVQAIPWRYNGRWCHMGFSRAHKAVRGWLQASVRPGVPLLITGHSLGGAGAELTAGLFAEHGAPVHLITFGKPNVFFCPRRTALGHLATQLSVVSGSDLVTRVPRLMFGPDPGQRMLYLANNGEGYIDPPADFRRLDWSNVISDHSLDVYAQRLTTALSELRYEKTITVDAGLVGRVSKHGGQSEESV